MRAMLLCAGLSTRLGPIAAARPKPMLPVCGVPILAYGIANAVAHGITDLVINTHHHGEVIEREIGDGARFGARIRYIHEPILLGTGGGLKHALGLLDPDGADEPFVSMNGKLIFDVDLTALVAAFRADRDALGMMVVRRVPDAKAWGAVQVVDGRITDILGDGDHMFCGVHVTRPSVMRRLPDGECDSIRQGYLPWLRGGERVAAWEHREGYFAEHSTPDRYVASNWALLGGERLRHPPTAKLAGIDPTARIHPTARIAGDVKIGAGAVIGAGVTVQHAVIGDGARVDADVENAIVWAGTEVIQPARDGIVITPER